MLSRYPHRLRAYHYKRSSTIVRVVYRAPSARHVVDVPVDESPIGFGMIVLNGIVSKIWPSSRLLDQSATLALAITLLTFGLFFCTPILTLLVLVLVLIIIRLLLSASLLFFFG